MSKNAKKPERFKGRSKRPPIAHQLFPLPALSEYIIREHRIKRAVRDYRRRLAERYGPDVPKCEIKAFEATLRATLPYFEQEEGSHAGLKAAQEIGQRLKELRRRRQSGWEAGGAEA